MGFAALYPSYAMPIPSNAAIANGVVTREGG